MTDYIIFLKNGFVQTYRVFNGIAEVMLFAGADRLPVENYMQEFKKKIEYSPDEKLALILIADSENFNIEHEISIADCFSNDIQVLSSLIDSLNYPDVTINTYPKVDLFPKLKPFLKIKSPDVPIELSTGKSLQDFYRNKTKSYREKK